MFELWDVKAIQRGNDISPLSLSLLFLRHCFTICLATQGQKERKRNLANGVKQHSRSLLSCIAAIRTRTLRTYQRSNEESFPRAIRSDMFDITLEKPQCSD